MVWVYDSEKLLVKNSQRKGTNGRVKEKPGLSFQVSSRGIMWKALNSLRNNV